MIRIQGIEKSYGQLKVLKGIDLSISEGEVISIVGSSGAGKSTLLHILGTLDRPDTGDYFFHDKNIAKLSEKELSAFRNKHIGFVFQFHYLLSEFSVLDNVMIPAQKLQRYGPAEVSKRAMERLDWLGIADQAYKMPNQLSGGQKQRVAIARALINDPLIIMGDEPTGNLDQKNSDIVFDIFRRLTREQGQTMLVVTHDGDFARRTDRIIELEDGRVISDGYEGR